ncbi:hypothetical protein E2C01_067760 [Portunus trituberculatus]|uniref:Uncharacterized protein n=1 Tax=Portunus trituberculatus TaxID=210409 RepID=A0A5B7HKN9_PORTR|nr:hypothetical protein [Portunus trituberculatus]
MSLPPPPPSPPPPPLPPPPPPPPQPPPPQYLPLPLSLKGTTPVSAVRRWLDKATHRPSRPRVAIKLDAVSCLQRIRLHQVQDPPVLATRALLAAMEDRSGRPRRHSAMPLHSPQILPASTLPAFLLFLSFTSSLPLFLLSTTFNTSSSFLPHSSIPPSLPPSFPPSFPPSLPSRH